MKNHPPDRRLDRPEPTEADLYAERARDEFIRAEAEAEEKRREQFVELMDRVHQVLEDGMDKDTADEWTAEIWREIRRGRAA